MENALLSLVDKNLFHNLFLDVTVDCTFSLSACVMSVPQTPRFVQSNNNQFELFLSDWPPRRERFVSQV